MKNQRKFLCTHIRSASNWKYWALKMATLCWLCSDLQNYYHLLKFAFFKRFKIFCNSIFLQTRISSLMIMRSFVHLLYLSGHASQKVRRGAVMLGGRKKNENRLEYTVYQQAVDIKLPCYDGFDRVRRMTVMLQWLRACGVGMSPRESVGGGQKRSHR